MKEDPTNAPITLRPHLEAKTAAASTQQVTEQVTEQAPVAAVPDQPAVLPPKTNTGTTPAPVQSSDLLKRGADDFEFYKANRDAIRKAWRGR
jgi:hypothetical protein